MTFEERKKYAEEKKRQKELRSTSATPSIQRQDSGPHHAQTFPSSLAQELPATEFEDAIRDSVATTSKGDPEEDKVIERAIRASVAELRRKPVANERDDVFQRAIQASVAEASRARNEQRDSVLPATDGPDDLDDHSAQLELALQRSLREQSYNDQKERNPSNDQWDDSGVDTDDDENIKLALKNSERDTVLSPTLSRNDDSELQKAIEQSRQIQQDREHAEFQAKTEEEIVLEYIKKQSLLEAEHQRASTGKGKAVATREDG